MTWLVTSATGWGGLAGLVVPLFLFIPAPAHWIFFPKSRAFWYARHYMAERIYSQSKQQRPGTVALNLR
jgi:hypothetical protein